MNNTAFRVLCFIYIIIMFHAIVAFKKSLYEILLRDQLLTQTVVTL